jgi:hypothetical protein
LTKVTTYLNDEEMRELDTLRGDIPRSRVMSRALRRYIIDVESGKQSLLPGRKVSNQAQTAALEKSFATYNPNTQGLIRKGDAG